MNSEQQKINCPYCEQKLLIDGNELTNTADGEISCPACGKSFLISGKTATNNSQADFEPPKPPKLSGKFTKAHPPVSPVPTQNVKSAAPPVPPPANQQQNTSFSPPPPPTLPGAIASSDNIQPDSNGIPHRYKWGRLYITLARIIAIITIITAVLALFYNLYNTWDTYRKDKENTISEYSSAILEAQKKFSASYQRNAQLLLTANSINTKIKFPTDITLIDPPFSGELSSIADITESLKTISAYENKLSVVENTMQNFFSSPYNRLFNLLKGGDAIKFNLKNTKNSSLSLNLGKDADFYDKDPEELLNALFSAIKYLRAGLENKNIHDRELEVIESGLYFIKQQLNAKKKTIALDSIKQNADKKISAGTNQYEAEKKLLNAIFQNIMLLCSKQTANPEIYHWLIVMELNDVKSKLINYHNALTSLEAAFKKAVKAVLWIGFLRILGAVITAFLILVFADYLEAHFDAASTLRKILSKYPLFFLLVIPLFFTGCENKEKKQLEEQSAELQSAVINQIFAEQIASNPDAQAFVVPGKTLYLISGGIPQNTKIKSPMDIVTFYRAYNAIMLKYTAVSKPGKITRSSSKKYSHKATLTVQLAYTIHKAPDQEFVRGIEVHGISPENAYQNDSWLKTKITAIPPADYDFAVVINHLNNMSPENNNSEVRTLNVFLNKNTGIWEIENADSSPDFATPQEMPSADQIANFMMKDGFHKLEEQDTGKEFFFVKTEEYENANKILNLKMVKHNGVWKPVEVVRQTAQFLQRLASYKNIANENVWIELLQIATQYPRAEKHNEFMAYLEKFAKTNYIDNKANDRKFLLYFYQLLKKHPEVKNLNNGSIIYYCLNTIKTSDSNFKHNVKEILKIFSPRIYSANKCLEIVQKDGYLSSDNEFIHNMQEFVLLLQLDSKKYIYMDKMLSSRTKIGNHNIFSPCDYCKRTGFELCLHCKNTNRCPWCNGKGIRIADEFDGTRRYTVSRDCVRHCTFCNGRRKICQSCNGYKKFVVRHKLQNAIKEEYQSIRSILALKLKHVEAETGL